MEMGDKTTRVLETRQKILDILKQRGPSLPIHVAKGSGISMIFAGAFLSELISEKYVKTSYMRVGGSPLYLLPGQEPMLENFYQHLGGKEKDAFIFLKEKKILEDERLDPAYRVALRSIKDFAQQMIVKQRLDGQEREFIFWRYFLFSEDEAKKAIEDILEPKKKTDEKDLRKEVREERAGEIGKHEEEQILEKESGVKEARAAKRKKPSVKTPVQDILPISHEELLPVQREIFGGGIAAPSEPVVEKTPFALNISGFLEKNSIRVIEEKGFSKKDYEALVELETAVGNIRFLAIGRDKKLVSESDLTAALQKAQALRLPALFIAPGKLNKKAHEYLDKWPAFIKFKRVE